MTGTMPREALARSPLWLAIVAQFALIQGAATPAQADAARQTSQAPLTVQATAQSSHSQDTDREMSEAGAPLEVTVYGETPLRHSGEAPSVASSVIDGEELQAVGSSTADVLNRVPGLQVTRTGAQSDVATASLRGADAQQVPVYVAGIRINDDVSGTADLSTIPLWMMDRVVVYRGNAPVAADRLGIGGAIFFWPRLPRSARLGSGGELGSFGAHAGWLAAEAGGPDGGILVGLRRSGADNDYPFIDDQGKRFDLDESERLRQNADFNQTDFWGITRYSPSTNVRTHTIVNVFSREQGITGLATLPSTTTRAETTRTLIGNTVTISCATQRFCSLELTNSFVTAGSVLSDPRRELPALRSTRVENDGQRTSHGVRLRTAVGEELMLTGNVSVELENAHIRRSQAPSRNAHRRSLLPSMHARWQSTPNLNLHALASLECHATRGTRVEPNRSTFISDEGCGVTEPAGRLGVQYRLSDDWELLANIGRYVRVPTLGELYGTSSVVQGNPTLDAEVGWNADTGVRWLSRVERFSLSLDAFAFVRRAENLIRFRRTSLDALTPFNVAEAMVSGVEVAAAIDALHHLRAELAVTALDPRETTDDPLADPTVNDILPHTSRLMMAGLLEAYIAPQAGALDRASLGLRFTHRSERFDDPAGQKVLPAQSPLDLEANASLWKRSLLVRAAIRNLFDERGIDLIGLPTPGRSFHLAAEAWF